MSNLNDFNREAKAALWVVLQWLLLAVPTGLVCGAVGTAFHLSVEYVTELRAAQSWLLLCLPLAGLAIVALYKVTKCEGVGTNNVIRAVQGGEPVSLLLVPAIFLGTVLTHLCGGSAGREGAALLPLLQELGCPEGVDEAYWQEVLGETRTMAEAYPLYLSTNAPAALPGAVQLSERSVKYQCEQAYHKLGTSNKVEALAAARKLNLL